MRALDCGCEVTDNGATLLSTCSLHAGYARAAVEIERKIEPAPQNVALTEKLLVAAMPTATELMARGGAGNDPQTVAERITQLVHEIQRRQS